MPFDWLTKPAGVTGIELKYVGHYHDSRVTDPVTGLKRRMSNRPLWHQEWQLRYDATQLGLVYGATFYAQESNNAYFFNEFRRQSDGVRSVLFIEYTKFKLGTVRLEVVDLPDFRRDRFIYADTRASGTLDQIVNSQTRTRSVDPAIDLGEVLIIRS